MTSRDTAVRAVVEAMWEATEDRAVSDLRNPRPDYTMKHGYVVLGDSTLVGIVRTLDTLGVTPEEVLAAVHAWADEASETDPRRYLKAYRRAWTKAVELFREENPLG